MWRFDVNGTELYDARARLWAPELGTFLSIDEFQYANRTTTLWGWPAQSPIRYADPSGRCGWVCAGIAVVAIGVTYGYILASDDAAMQREAHPVATENPAVGLALSVGLLAPASVVAEVGSLGSTVGAAPLAGAGALANSSQSCSANSQKAIDAARQACPGGDCKQLSELVKQNLGPGSQRVTLVNPNGPLLDTAKGVFNGPQGFHQAVLQPDGTVADPLLNTTFPTLQAFVHHVLAQGAAYQCPVGQVRCPSAV